MAVFRDAEIRRKRIVDQDVELAVELLLYFVDGGFQLGALAEIAL